MPALLSFKYDPIPIAQARSSIRLLTLLPGERGTQIRCDLRLAAGIFEDGSGEMEEAGQSSMRNSSNTSTRHVPFEAVSYVWGDAKITTPIIVDGCELRVTTNLERLLQRLRDAEEPRVIWADAICIDQSNLDERSSQVTLMAQIYTSARKVLVWLGEEDEYTEPAFRAIKKLAIGAAIHNEEMLATLVEDDAAFTRPEVLADLEFGWADLTLEQVKAIENAFYDASWWNRLWTVQEVVLAKTATLMCGSYSMPWNIVQMLLEPYDAYRDPARTLARQTIATRSFLAVQRWLALHTIKHGGSSRLSSGYTRRSIHDVLYRLLLDTSPRQCTDPRDIVYGILSLVEFKGEAIIPDYNKSTSAVYTELARTLIRERRSLSTICCRPISSDVSGRLPFSWLKQGDILPSWVPDYYCPRYSRIVRDAEETYSAPEMFNADKRSALDVEAALSESSHILRLQRIKWDTVSYASRPDPDVGSTMATRAATAQTWKGIIQDLTYPSGEDMATVFYRTLNQDMQTSTSGKMERLHESVVQRHKDGFDTWCNLDPGDHEPYRILFKQDPESGARQRIFSESGDSDEAKLDFKQLLLSLLISMEKTFVVTSKGYIGAVDGLVEIGDEIAIVRGACVPLALRATGNIRGEPSEVLEVGSHTLVGAAYIHGIMDGEVIDIVGSEHTDDILLV